MNRIQYVLYQWMRKIGKPIVVGFDRLKHNSWTQPYLLLEEDILRIKSELKGIGVSVEDIKIDKNEYECFEKDFGLVKFPLPKDPRYDRKVAEYYLVHSILNFKEIKTNMGMGYKYIDAACLNSPWAEWLENKYNITAYNVDLNIPMYKREHFIQADVTKLPFADSSIDAISMQSALELLPKDLDSRFIKECGRVLKTGGVAVILPIYLNRTAYSVYGKSYYKGATPEKGSIKCARFDYNTEFTRLYSVKTFKERIINKALDNGMDYIVYYIMNQDINLIDKKDRFIYLRFALVLKKH